MESQNQLNRRFQKLSAKAYVITIKEEESLNQ